jgi:uncharacterized membrane protein YedE/YeeE
MISFISQPWPWYVSGLTIALVMGLLLLFGRSFGFSSNLSNICSMLGAGRRIPFFHFDWKKEQWNLWFLIGAVGGGFIAMYWLRSPVPMRLSTATVDDLRQLRIPFDGRLEPAALFNWSFLSGWRGLILFPVGGFLVGFGTRYAGGCTSGHAISGLSDLQLPSLIAVIGFFAGGMIMTHLFFPMIFR